MKSPNDIIEEIKDLKPEEQFEVLDRYMSEAQYVIDTLHPYYRKTLEDMYNSGNSNVCGERHICRVNTTTHNILNEQLFLGHKDVYMNLAEKGALVLPKGKAKMLDGIADDCVETTVSTNYQLRANKDNDLSPKA